MWDAFSWLVCQRFEDLANAFGGFDLERRSSSTQTLKDVAQSRLDDRDDTPIKCRNVGRPVINAHGDTFLPIEHTSKRGVSGIEFGERERKLLSTLCLGLTYPVQQRQYDGMAKWAFARRRWQKTLRHDPMVVDKIKGCRCALLP